MCEPEGTRGCSPPLCGFYVCNGDQEKQEKGVPGPTPRNFCSSQTLPMSQNRLTIHSCLFAERTRAQSVLNS